MKQISLLAAVLMIAAAAPARSDEDSRREASLRASAEAVLVMSDEDYRDLAKTQPESSRWAKLDRSGLLVTAFRSLAA